MSVTSTTRRVSYTGNGVTTAFSFPFKVLQSSHLHVYFDGAEQFAGFTVSGVGSDAGGSVTFSSAPADGVTVLLLRTVPYTQEFSIVNNETVLESVIGVALDKQTMAVQQISEDIGRGLQLDPAELTSIGPLPLRANRAGKVLGFDTNGDPTPVTKQEVGAIVVGTADITDGAVTAAKIADSSITSAKIADGTIATADLANQAVTPAKSLHGAWATVASAGTVDLGAQAGRNIVISGTTAITSFGTTGAADFIPFVVRFSGVLTLTNGANLILPTGANITTAANDTAIVVWEGANVWRVIAYQRADGTALAAAAAGGLPAGYLTGLGLTYASATSYTVATGTACSEDGSAKTMTLASALTKNLGSFAVGTGNGSLDTGTIAANQTYHVHEIQRVSDNLVDILLSLSASAPTMPSIGGTWTARRRIGSVMTNGSSQLVQWMQKGDYFKLSTPSLDVSALALSTARSTLTLKVPTGLVLRAICRVVNSGASGTLVAIQDLDETDAAPSSTAAPLADAVVAPSTGLLAGRVEAFTNTSAQIAARASAAGNTFYLSTLGWVDTRGK